jgi:hypothetical protein
MNGLFMTISRLLKIIILTPLWLVFSCFVALAAPLGSDDMLNDLEIPLMVGLVENLEESMVFDSPEGSIVIAQARGKINPSKIYDYYRVVLPSLSWKIIKDSQNKLKCEDGAVYCLKAKRDQENLIVSIKTAQKTSMVIYSLSPF